MQKQDRPGVPRREPPTFHLDAADADWIKRGHWDIPASNIEELRAWLFWQQMSVSTFRELTVYKAHVDDMPWLRELEEER